ncbi:MAG: phosphoribosylformylglycinamidine synthase subunit PurQ [Pseudomonadota bacterium]
MRAAVIVFPASNCDRDAAVAIERLTGHAPHMVWHAETSLPEGLDLIVLPGGFSHGDYLRCGAMAARAAIMSDVVKCAQAGVPTLGICNGFQILTEAALLPGVLMRNAAIRFIAKDAHIRVEHARGPFMASYDVGNVLQIPVAHHDGNYFADAETLARLTGEAQIAFRYCTAAGEVTPDANINGAQDNIAGITDASGRILGMMPHPERAIGEELGSSDGAALFAGLQQTLAA